MLLAKALHDLSDTNIDRKLVLIQNLKLAEKLAKTNLRIEFLTACRRSRLSPRFIQDSLKTVKKTFSGLRKFDEKCSDFAKYLLTGSISAAFEERAYLERKRKRLHHELCDLNLEQHVFNWVKDTCRNIYCSTIDENRPGLIKKFLALQNRVEHDEHDFRQDTEQESNRQVPKEARVRNLSSLALDPGTEGLLAYGPKFGITPKVDRHLITDVEKNIERFAYGKRWVDEIERIKTERNRNAEERGLTGPHIESNVDGDAVEVVPERQNEASNSNLFGDARFPDANKRQPPLSSNDTEERLVRLKSSVLRIYKQHSNLTRNVTEEQLDGLEKLRKNDEIVVKPSDKCKGLVILDKTDYISKANQILDDQSNYMKLDQDKTAKIEASTKRLFKQVVRDKLPDKCIEELTPNHSRTPVFYGLPKDHKPSVPLRPVVATCGGPTEKTSWMLDKILQQLLQFVPLHLTDTNDFLHRLQQFWGEHNVPENAIFFSIDVVNLYGSIPVNDAVEAVREALLQYEDRIDTAGLSVDDICDLLQHCLKNNVFRFGHQFYMQKEGVAMGNPVAPAVAILYLDRFERLALERASLKPDFLARYIDDYAGVWLHGKEALNDFVTYLNGIDERIQFTCDMSGEGEGSVSMLDTLITLNRGEGRCSFRSELYVKPNNAGIILHYRSAHPKHTKLNTLRSQFLRAVRLSSDEDCKKRSLNKIRDIFAMNGYPAHVLNSVQRQVERSTGSRRDSGRKGRDGTEGKVEKGMGAADGEVQRKRGGAEDRVERRRGEAEGRVERGRGAAEGEVQRKRGGAEGSVERRRGEAEGRVERGRGAAEGEVQREKGGAEGRVERGRGGAEGRVERRRGEAEGEIQRERSGSETRVQGGRGRAEGEVERSRSEAVVGAEGGQARRVGGGEDRMHAQEEERAARLSDRQSSVLLLPYVNETVLCKVKRAARNSGLNVNVASYTPDTLKRKLVHSSLSGPPCPSGNRTCNTCKMITKGKCTDKNVIYELQCKLCGDTYIGESKRPLRLRYNEHLRSAVNNTKLTPVGDHFDTCHSDVSRESKLSDPPLNVKVLMKARDHPDRKIAESLCIRDKKPKLNDRMSSWRVM